MQTLARPVEPLFGSFDAVLPGTVRRLVDGFNREIAKRVRGGADLLLDTAAVAESAGLAEWHDPTLWNIGKVAFANAWLPLYAEAACRLIATFRGKSRRCLVLDLDNTVWGGVVGDLGAGGIRLGEGSGEGEAPGPAQRSGRLWVPGQ